MHVGALTRGEQRHPGTNSCCWSDGIRLSEAGDSRLDYSPRVLVARNVADESSRAFHQMVWWSTALVPVQGDA